MANNQVFRQVSASISGTYFDLEDLQWHPELKTAANRTIAQCRRTRPIKLTHSLKFSFNLSRAPFKEDPRAYKSGSSKE